MRATIFHIQRFSLHDGPGIRTLVFFKGCPLRCLWCSNPESQTALPQLMFSRALCIQCGNCAEACPHCLIRMGEGRHEILRDRCDCCGKCAAVCPSNALRITGQKLTVEELMHRVLLDRLFYLRSGGGVTLSGGEALMQGDYCRMFLKDLKRHHIHTAVETCGFVSKTTLLSVLPFVDHFLFDYKLHERHRHTACTGVDNRPILRNLLMLKEAGANIVLRLPLIPGINMNKGHYDAVIRIVNKLKIKSVNLLPFHHYGKNKYPELGMEYRFADLAPPDRATMDKVRKYFSKRTEAKIS